MALLFRVQRISRHVSRFSKVQARSLVTGGEPTVVLDEDRTFVCGHGKGSGDRPIVVLCGWAGAKHKHLDKYAQLYR